MGIAENIGDIPINSNALGNLGIIAVRSGELVEAVAYYTRTLTLTEQLRDPFSVSLWYGYLAEALQEQGKLGEAASALCRALMIGRTTNFTPCIGFALVALGKLRIAQTAENNHRQQLTSSRHLIIRAKASLQRALALEGLEAETRTEGQIALARATFLLGEINSAHQQVLKVIHEAQYYHQVWLIASAECLLGSILSVQSQREELIKCFSRSLQTLKERGLRLEWARTLRDYSEAILQHAHQDDDDYNPAIVRLQEAREVFQECGAALDLDLADRLLAAYAAPIPAAVHKRDR